jgi:regulation of enolase protein 1 (concanavalin A-like superfamily)
MSRAKIAAANEAARRAEAAAAALRLVEGLSRDVTDRAPVKLERASRPLWARLTRRSEPFRVSRAEVAAWFAGIEARHPPLVVTAQTADSSRIAARPQETRVA